MSASTELISVGPLLREWRERRHLSQLQLASQAGTSTRHLSYLETGRARPSRAMVLRLAGTLQVPVRDRNTLLLSAGHSPEYPEYDLNDPAMHAVRAALELILTQHEPHPAAVLDAGWNLLRANSAFRRLTIDVDPRLLEPPVNIARLVLHPDALAPSIVNVADWQKHVTDRLRRQVALTGNPELTALLAEIQTYPPAQEKDILKVPLLGGAPQLTMPLHLRLSTGEFKLFSTIAAFGTPLDATVSELAIEMFFAADDTTAAALRETADRATS